MNKIMHVTSVILLFFSFSTYSEGNEQVSSLIEDIEELKKEISESITICKEAKKDIKNQLQDDYLLIKKELKKAINMTIESEQINNDINCIVIDMINEFKSNEMDTTGVIDEKRKQLESSILAMVAMHLNQKILNEQEKSLLCVFCAEKMIIRLFGLFFEKMEAEYNYSVM